MRQLGVTHLAFLTLFLVGWDHVLSPEAFFSVRPDVDYGQLRDRPEAYLGATLALAGRIAECRPEQGGTTLEIVCYTRDRDDRPEQPDGACGRFLAHTERLLDAEAYRPGRLVTLTGTLRGQETRRLGEGEYAYLVFRIGEIYLWPPPAPRRRLTPRPWPWHDPFCDPFRPFHRRGCWDGW